MGRNQSPLAVCTVTTSAMGSPQNRAESPRSNRPNAFRSSALGAESGMRPCSDVEVGVFSKATFIIIEEPHGFGGLHAIGFDCLIHLRLHLAFQFIFIVLNGGEGLTNRR